MAQKVLIVDDDEAILELYSSKLIDSGFEVKVSEQGKEGFELARDFQPDVILLDLSIPYLEKDGLDGLQMLQKLRATDWGRHTKVIILTNTDRDKAPSPLDNLEISRYVVKVDESRDQVVSHVKEVLSTK